MKKENHRIKIGALLLLIPLLLTAGCGRRVHEESVPAGLRVRVGDITFDRGPITRPLPPGDSVTISPQILSPTSDKYELQKLKWSWDRNDETREGYEGNSLTIEAGQEPEKIVMNVETTWEKKSENGAKLVRDSFNRIIYVASGTRRKKGDTEVKGFDIGHYPEPEGKYCFFRGQLVVTTKGYQLYHTADTEATFIYPFKGELLTPVSPDTGGQVLVQNDRVAVVKNDTTYWLPVKAVKNPGTIRRYPELYRGPRIFYPVTRRNRRGYVVPGIKWKNFDHDKYVRNNYEGSYPRYIPVKLSLLSELDQVRKELARSGHSISLELISGSRNPAYNLANIGKQENLKAIYSRHQYGDAVDLVVDGTGNGRMDDLNGDGEVNVEDVRELAGIVKSIRSGDNRIYGGIGIYGHHDVEGRKQTPYLHVDQRGLEVSWEVTR